ncbi:MAG: hypothetical protein IPN32_19835 [Deltaproteobacteria bacterium]|nr:hypothetical protein [Deltaproteobacteria bacterium]
MARPDGSNRATPRWPLRLALALSLASALALQTGDGEAVAKPAKGKRAADDAGDALPVSSIKPGMKGYAVTVFSGTGTDRFEIEVIDTIDNYLPHQDAVLFRANDPRLEHSGIVGGMSGSPIYIEGKLVGALSYGWRFNKDPVGALTPISNMLEVGALPYRPDVLPHPAAGGARKGAAAWADAMLGLRTDPLPPRRRPQELDPAEGLVPLTVPLSVSGLGNGATRMLVDSFGLQPVRGGGAGGRAEDTAKAATPKTWKPGDSVSVVLVRGDSSVAGNGTVTWVGPKGDRLLAFGHSMFNDGPTNVPIADARVHDPQQRRALGEALVAQDDPGADVPGPTGRDRPAYRSARADDPDLGADPGPRSRPPATSLRQPGRRGREPDAQPGGGRTGRGRRRGRTRRHRGGRQGEEPAVDRDLDGPARRPARRRGVLPAGRHRPHARQQPQHRTAGRGARQPLRGRCDPQGLARGHARLRCAARVDREPAPARRPGARRRRHRARADHALVQGRGAHPGAAAARARRRRRRADPDRDRRRRLRPPLSPAARRPR